MGRCGHCLEVVEQHIVWVMSKGNIRRRTITRVSGQTNGVPLCTASLWMLWYVAWSTVRPDDRMIGTFMGSSACQVMHEKIPWEQGGRQ